MPAASTILDRRWFFFARLAGRSRAQDATLHSPSIVLVSASLPPSLLFTYIHSHTLYPHTSRLTVHEAVRKQHHPLVLSCPCWSFPSPSFFLSLTLCHPSPPRRSTHPVERTIWNSTVRSCTLVSPLTDNSHPSPSHHPTFQPQLCSVALWPPPCSHLPEARTDGRPPLSACPSDVSLPLFYPPARPHGLCQTTDKHLYKCGVLLHLCSISVFFSVLFSRRSLCFASLLRTCCVRVRTVFLVLFFSAQFDVEVASGCFGSIRLIRSFRELVCKWVSVPCLFLIHLRLRLPLLLANAPFWGLRLPSHPTPTRLSSPTLAHTLNSYLFPCSIFSCFLFLAGRSANTGVLFWRLSLLTFVSFGCASLTAVLCVHICICSRSCVRCKPNAAV